MPDETEGYWDCASSNDSERFDPDEAEPVDVDLGEWIERGGVEGI